MTFTPHNMPKQSARIAADLRSRMCREMSRELGFVGADRGQFMRSVDLLHTTRAGTTK
jgi:hypothetical protein